MLWPPSNFFSVYAIPAVESSLRFARNDISRGELVALADDQREVGVLQPLCPAGEFQLRGDEPRPQHEFIGTHVRPREPSAHRGRTLRESDDHDSR